MRFKVADFMLQIVAATNDFTEKISHSKMSMMALPPAARSNSIQRPGFYPNGLRRC